MRSLFGIKLHLIDDLTGLGAEIIYITRARRLFILQGRGDRARTGGDGF